ncbi:hypothetical protein HDF16_006208 [Granulicella aggregans]|uniref:Uncharacterized protein n=1 Tax=Granulicella aggregans TaxID=474949 RepID=A0A7W8E793_9BACT|nr:hypothetical protein [Granulicella aggregans]MBB5061472.1 hypothetical protein [Granulicella aggregans]
MGDPITVDLVFTAMSNGYAVLMDGNRFNAPQDLVNITPTVGWFRSVGNRPGGSPENLSQQPVRIPVALNRSIVFEQPGHYEITVTTSRLVPSRTGVSAKAAGACCTYRNETTNAIGIDILPRGEHEESVLVTQLSTRLEKMPEPFASEAWKKENEPLIRQLENQVKNPPADPKLTMDLVGKLQAKQAEDEARLVTQTQSRQKTATRLSYLQGDDAVRAKVRWLLMDKEDGSGDATGDVMLHGLAQSRNLQLQLDLLQAAWDDTGRVPTGVLQSALQQTKAFLQNETFELYDSHGVPGRMMPHAEVVAEINREYGEIATSLPQRTGLVHDETAYFLMMHTHLLNAADALTIRAEIARDFGGLTPTQQTMLLGMHRRELCDPALPTAPEPLRSSCASTTQP